MLMYHKELDIYAACSMQAYAYKNQLQEGKKCLWKKRLVYTLTHFDGLLI